MLRALKFKLPARQLNFFNHGNVGLLVLRHKDKEHVHHTDPGHDTTVWQRPELIGPGNKDELSIPTQLTQAVGKERIQFKAASEGKDGFQGMMDTLEDRYGTKDNPVLVPSPDEDRIIGCQGAPGDRHIINWMIVTEDGHKYWEYGHNRCPECGNTFKIKKVDLQYQSIA